MTWTPPWRAFTPPAVVSSQSPPHYCTTDRPLLHNITTSLTTIIITHNTASHGRVTTRKLSAMSPRSHHPPPPPHLQTRPKPASDGHNPCTSLLSGRYMLHSLVYTHRCICRNRFICILFWWQTFAHIKSQYKYSTSLKHTPSPYTFLHAELISPCF